MLQSQNIGLRFPPSRQFTSRRLSVQCVLRVFDFSFYGSTFLSFPGLARVGKGGRLIQGSVNKGLLAVSQLCGQNPRASFLAKNGEPELLQSNELPK
jgi:hypothetical protein